MYVGWVKNWCWQGHVVAVNISAFGRHCYPIVIHSFHAFTYTARPQKQLHTLIFCWTAFCFDYGAHLQWHCFDNLMQLKTLNICNTSPVLCPLHAASTKINIKMLAFFWPSKSSVHCLVLKEAFMQLQVYAKLSDQNRKRIFKVCLPFLWARTTSQSL